MTEEGNRNRLDSYSRRAMRYRGYRKSELESRVCDVRETIARLQEDDPGLAQRIEDKLADPLSFRRSDEQRILLLVVASVAGDGRTRPGRTKEQPLGRWDLATDEADDPAVISEWRDLRGALEREIQALPERERGILGDVYLEGKSQVEVSRERGVNRQKVNRELQRAIEVLAERIGHLRDIYTPGR
jgi:RNA polymerase sigma factor (sigma-70 family)